MLRTANCRNQVVGRAVQVFLSHNSADKVLVRSLAMLLAGEGLNLFFDEWDNRHYRIDAIAARHFFQTADKAGLPRALVRQAIEDVASGMPKAIARLETELPAGWVSTGLHEAAKAGTLSRLRVLKAGLGA